MADPRELPGKGSLKGIHALILTATAATAATTTAAATTTTTTTSSSSSCCLNQPAPRPSPINVGPVGGLRGVPEAAPAGIDAHTRGPIPECLGQVGSQEAVEQGRHQVLLMGQQVHTLHARHGILPVSQGLQLGNEPPTLTHAQKPWVQGGPRDVGHGVGGGGGGGHWLGWGQRGVLLETHPPLGYIVHVEVSGGRGAAGLCGYGMHYTAV